jgi:glycosyltransferase involved in cell wall biosynthesis
MRNSLYFLFYLYLDWDSCNQRGLITALAKEVFPNKVICINRPADLLVSALHHQGRLADSLSKRTVQYLAENLVLFRPFFPLNDYAASWIPGFNRLQSLWLRSLLTQMGLAPTAEDRVVIWLFTCFHWPFAHLFPSPLVVYHPVDDYTLTAQGQLRPHFVRHEKKMFTECDVVFTLSEGLAKTKASLHHNIHCLGQGVSFDLFSQSMHPNLAIPKEMLDIPSPRIGLVGNIRDWIDFPLIAKILRRYPEWSIVFIGPQDPSAAESMELLKDYPNFFWLGPKPFQELPHWLAGLDVGLVPYLQTEGTRFTTPTKLYEYWAAGLPVVITNIGEFQRVKECLWIGDSADEFIDSLRNALRANSPPQKGLRTQLAKAHSWENVAKRAIGYLHDNI